MNTNDRLIKKTYMSIWLTSGINLLLGIACVLIDAVFVGQYLGAEAVAAAALVQPIAFLVNIVGALLGPGLAIVCTKYLGMARKDMVNKAFSTVVITEFAVTIVVALTLYFSSHGLSLMLGGNADNQTIVEMSEAYLRGFSLAVLPMVFDVTLSSLMILDNDQRRGVVTTVSILLSDVLFDYLNVTVFNGGMYGMAIATALSQVVGLVVVVTHFFRKERILHFYFKSFDFSIIKEVVLGGVPNAVSMGSNAVKGIVLNAFLLAASGQIAVAAFGAASSLFTIVSALALGVFNSSAALTSFLYGEEDRSSIIKALKISMKHILILLLAALGVCFVFAGYAVRMFLDETAVEQIELAAVFVRYMSVMYLLFALSYPLSGLYQGTGKKGLNYLFVGLRECIFPVIPTVCTGLVFGLKGFEAGFIIAGFMALLCCIIIPSIVNKKISFKINDLVLLPKDFGPGKNEVCEFSLKNMKDVTEASAQIMEFGQRQGLIKRLSFYTALFVEEMAGNSIIYGGKNNRNVQVDVRVICYDGRLTIRLRDDGTPFDPIGWLAKNSPDDPASGIGIKIITGLAKDVQYIPTLGLNNLIMIL